MALPTDLKQGTVIQILNTENVAQRFPDLVGQYATIDKVPVHPSTWFTVRTSEAPTKTLKLQPTALKVVGNSPVSTSDENTDAPQKARPGRPRSNSMDSQGAKSRIYSTPDGTSHAHTLTLGAEVVIRATDSVLQRTPHLAGQIGYVKEVPVHPATWFKVRLSDNAVHTFRPSALRLSTQPEEEMVESSPYRPLPSTRTKPGSGKQSHASALAVPALSLPPPALVEDQLKPGTIVKIVSGRLHGQTAQVVRVTNGWVQVETSYGEVAKRASDLEICNDGNNLSGFEGNVSIAESKRGRGRPARSSKPNRYYNDDESNATSYTSSYKRLSIPTAYNSEMYQRKYENASDEMEDTPSRPSPPTYTRSSSDEIIYPFASKIIEEEDMNTIPECWKSLDIPFADPSKRKLKRAHIQNYVNSQQDTIRTRPDFKYWLSQLNGCIIDEFGIEKSLSADFCPVCATEKWTGGKMCWNETCSSSPVYLFKGQLKPVPAVSNDEDVNTPVLSNSTTSYTQDHQPKILPSTTVYSEENVPSSHTMSVTFSSNVVDDESLPVGYKRPREDSIATTDVEGTTPERSWSSEDLAMKALCDKPISLPPNSGAASAAPAAPTTSVV